MSKQGQTKGFLPMSQLGQRQLSLCQNDRKTDKTDGEIVCETEKRSAGRQRAFGRSCVRMDRIINGRETFKPLIHK